MISKVNFQIVPLPSWVFQALPAFDPAVLIKIALLAYSRGTVSSRKMAAAGTRKDFQQKHLHDSMRGTELGCSTPSLGLDAEVHMKNKRYSFFENKNVNAGEVIDLLVAVGWGSKADYESSAVLRSLAAYPFIGHARDTSDRLVGYVSAFSDGAFSTFIGELVVHPDAQDEGIGAELLSRVERRYSGVPIYTLPFDDAREFFFKRGYRIPKRAMSVVSKRNAAA